ncbi:MAG: hypothetical protein H0U57_12105 [Tatlockia sp.]|nr:hypothetical protein [Tatlockia sp.]
MQQKSELTDLTNEILEFVGRPVRKKNNLEPNICINPFNRLIESYNWYEKAMLEMIRAKGIDSNLYELWCVFYVLRTYQSDNKDLGEIIYIMDQFARRLETLETSKNTIDEIALISALVGMKAASDFAVWNIDFLDLYNSCLNFSTCETISLNKINELEKQHLVALDYIFSFSENSKMNERLLIIMNHLDLKGIQTIEKELQKLKFNGEGSKLGSSIQKAIFQKASETNLSFFRKGSQKSKTDNDSVSLEETVTVLEEVTAAHL